MPGAVRVTDRWAAAGRSGDATGSSPSVWPETATLAGSTPAARSAADTDPFLMSADRTAFFLIFGAVTEFLASFFAVTDPFAICVAAYAVPVDMAMTRAR